MNAVRYIQKARVNSYDEYADALQAAQRAVKKQAEASNDLDSDVKVNGGFIHPALC